ncbi:MAG: hypothetical protein EBX90_10705, partial [Betaproteobacteria bacterium]|nr:hypothetical protein [Betaproteobacteria bacterium]
DDCGTRINPMIIEGQIHGGLTEGFAVAMGQQMRGNFPGLGVNLSRCKRDSSSCNGGRSTAVGAKPIGCCRRVTLFYLNHFRGYS